MGYRDYVIHPARPDDKQRLQQISKSGRRWPHNFRQYRGASSSAVITEPDYDEACSRLRRLGWLTWVPADPGSPGSELTLVPRLAGYAAAAGHPGSGG